MGPRAAGLEAYAAQAPGERFVKENRLALLGRMKRLGDKAIDL